MNGLSRREQAINNFKSGYSCTQSLVLAFLDLTELSQDTAMRLASSFGGGMGRLREVCGAVSGMFMVTGLLYGYTEPSDLNGKAEHYARIRYLADQFRDRNKFIVCRELLGEKKAPDSFVPEARTEAYYKKRPCAELIGDAAEILEEYILTHAISEHYNASQEL